MFRPHKNGVKMTLRQYNGEAMFVDLCRVRNVIALFAEAKNVDYPYNIVPTLLQKAYC